MSIIQSDLLLGQEGSSKYQVSRSLRFSSGDSSYLSRTPASAGNRKTWTWSAWVKRSRLGANEALFAVFSSADSFSQIGFTSGDALEVINYQSGNAARKNTTQVFRDCSAWSHILVAATSSTLSVYFNGSEITAFSTNVAPNGADWLFNSTSLHSLGGRSGNNDQYSSLYLAEIHFIDGQALTPSDFAETDATTGQWIPKLYSGGSYGTNGFKLTFADNSAATATTLGKDAAGSNNWTPNNFSVTAGAGNDSLVDTPTSYGTDTGAGGEVRGNYCTWNTLDKASVVTLSNGNLDAVSTSFGENRVRGTIQIPDTDSWYFEITVGSPAAGYIGIASASAPLTSGSGAKTYGYNEGGNFYTDGSVAGSGAFATFTTNDVIGVKVTSNSTITFYKNGTQTGTSKSIDTSYRYFPLLNLYNMAVVANFGQRPWAYPANASGAKALCDTNLTAPVIAKPNTAMDVVLYTGNGSSQTISGLNFSPDLVWIKQRSANRDHCLCDVVRGTSKRLRSNTTDAETTESVVTAFNSNGFDIGSDAGVNASSGTYVGWCFDGGTSTVSNTQGSITSSVRANASAGFSIIDFSATNGTVGHGLGVAPEFFIYKVRTSASNWSVYHKSLGNTKRLLLNTTDAEGTSSIFWNNTSPTSSVITLGSNFSGAGSSIIYAFAPVAGYSAMSSFTGTSGQNFVHLGFRPKLLMIKNSSNGSYPAYTGWAMFDSSRSTYNVNTNALWANSSQQEGLRGNGGTVTTADFAIDLLSNGFCLRDNGASEINLSGNTYIYCAWAESPFQYARAR